MDYSDYYHTLANEYHELAHELADVGNLEGVLAWMKGRSLDLAGVRMVNQDEYHYDFVIPLQEEGRHLVFGITGNGVLTAVTAWDHSPSPDELLDRRLRDGWTPTPTKLQSGPKILGHAARLDDSPPKS